MGEPVTVVIGASQSDMIEGNGDVFYPPPFTGLASDRGSSARALRKSSHADHEGGSPTNPGWGPVEPSSSLDLAKFTYNIGSRLPEGAQVLNARLVVRHSGTIDDGVALDEGPIVSNTIIQRIYNCVCGFFSGPNCGPEGPIPYEEPGYAEPPQLTTWGAEWSETHNSFTAADYKTSIASNAVSGQPINAGEGKAQSEPFDEDWWYVDLQDWQSHITGETEFATLLFGIEQDPLSVNVGSWLNGVTPAETAASRECDPDRNPPPGYPYLLPSWTFPIASVQFYTFLGQATRPRLEIVYDPDPVGPPTEETSKPPIVRPRVMGEAVFGQGGSLLQVEGHVQRDDERGIVIHRAQRNRMTRGH